MTNRGYTHVDLLAPEAQEGHVKRNISLGVVSFAVLALAAGCGGDDDGGLGTGGSAGASGGSAGSSSGGSSGSSSGGSAGSGGSNTGGSAGSSSGGSAGSSTGGSAGSGGSNTGGSAGSGGSNTGGSAGSGGSNTGGSGGASGGSGGTGGGPGLTCKQLASNYAATLAKAKSCNPIISVLQCTTQVDDELACPCPTFINPGNAAEVTELAKLKVAWKTQNCSAGVVCPLVLCAQPPGANCVGASGNSGSCVDKTN